jgi:MFS family permease
MKDSRKRWPSRLPFYYGWVIVGIAFVTMAIGVSARTTFSLLLPPLVGEFGWTPGLVAGAFSFGFLVSAAISPIAGRLMDRDGPRVVIESGVCLTACGLLLAPAIEKPWQLYATLGVLVGSGANLMSFTAQSLFLPNWFVRRRGLAISIAFSGVGVGAIVLLPWLQKIIGQHGWRASCRAMDLLVLLVLGPLNLLARRRPEDIGLLPDGRSHAEGSATPAGSRTLSIQPGRPSIGRSHGLCAPVAFGGSCSDTSVPCLPGMPCRFTRRNTLSKSVSVRSSQPGLWAA